jgi:hypothetical protein
MQHDFPLPSSAAIKGRQTLMDQDIPLPFDLPAVVRKKLSAAFAGGRIISDGGVMLLAQAERRSRFSISSQPKAGDSDYRHNQRSRGWT